MWQAIVNFIESWLISILEHINSFTHNWGVTIILFAVVIKIVLYPTTQKTYKSMKDMQRVQPELEKIQKMYKGDMEKIQSEQMALYKKHGVNPFGGCLPMLLQMPVIICIWSAISHRPEVFEKAYFLWMHPGPLQNLFPNLTASSLAGRDLPMLIFYALTMYLSQKLTPTQANSPINQNFMALFMTGMITYVAWVGKFPGAMLLYWSVFTFLTLAQQAFIMRASDKPKTLPESAPAPSESPAT